MEKITLSHGSGGRKMHELLNERIVPRFGMERILTDAAVLEVDASRGIAFSTDSFVVSPIFFPGGNIGDLAVNGSVNDIAMMGAVPKYLSVALILEEGLDQKSLEDILVSMQKAAEIAEVRIVSGDTKVVERGKGDRIFINTSCIGYFNDTRPLHPSRIKPGDRIIVSSSIGNHGIAIMSERNGLVFEPPIISDTAPLNGLVSSMLSLCNGINAMRDPTRGGLATVLKEIAIDTNLGMSIFEEEVPIENGVVGACELLGLDPLYVANEGVLVAFVEGNVSEFLLEKMQKHPNGRRAAIIGEVTESNPGMVLLKTRIGGTRIVDMLSGEQLPRIC